MGSRYTASIGLMFSLLGLIWASTGSPRAPTTTLPKVARLSTSISGGASCFFVFAA